MEGQSSKNSVVFHSKGRVEVYYIKIMKNVVNSSIIVIGMVISLITGHSTKSSAEMNGHWH